MQDDTTLEVEYITTTRLGEKGQLTIPKEFRDSLKLVPGSPMAVLRIGTGLMLFSEKERFTELCNRLAEVLPEQETQDPNLVSGIVTIIANQERIIANQEKILENQERILAK